MKKKKTLGTRIIIAVMAVLAYGILSAGITGTVCLVQQSNSDMKNSMSERVSSASNLLSSTIQHYVSMIATLDGTTAQVNDIIASDSNIVEINTHPEGSAGVTTNSDGYIVVTGTYPKGTASITTSTAWLGNIVNTMHTSDTTEFYLLTNDGRLLASMNGSLSAEQVAGYMNITDVETVSDNGRNHIVTASPILGTDWTAVVACDAKEFLGNAHCGACNDNHHHDQLCGRRAGYFQVRKAHYRSAERHQREDSRHGAGQAVRRRHRGTYRRRA